MIDYKPIILIIFTVGIILIANKGSTETRINPSDVVCTTILKCTRGNLTFEPGDIVSNPSYSLYKIGTIITLDSDDKTAIIKWSSGETSTEKVIELNKVKKL
jgi:hypothetical protein